MATNQSGLDHVSVPVSILIGAVIIAVSILLAGIRISKAPALAVGAAPTVAGQAAAKPTVQNRTGDIKQVKTAGNPIIGSASAPVVIAYWFDYQCPVCQRFEEQVMTQIKRDYIDTGKIRVVYKDLQFLGPDSQTLGLTARAVWQLAPDKFVAWHKSLFDNQGRENSGWATPDAIRKFSEPVLGADLTTKVMALAESNKTAFKTKMDADKSEGGTFGINATPSFIIGSKVLVGLYPYETVKAAIDEALKK
ncbi:MAG TPA: thioredoxin domain-containing protein [Candidatus Paceibacterota bacterium]